MRCVVALVEYYYDVDMRIVLLIYTPSCIATYRPP